MDKSVDVFISHHTSTCLPVTQAICHSLESCGLRCWYAPRDTDQAYAASIVSAINQCRVFVLVLNYQSSVSQDVLNEINLAVERLRKGETLAILPFQISADMIGDDAKYYIGRIHWIDAVTPPMEQRIEELKLRILTVLERSPLLHSAVGLTPSAGTLKSSNLLPNSNFVGRQAEIAQLDSLIADCNKLFLQGMGGIGKSELAKAYALRHRDRYSTVVFATYHTSLQDTVLNDSGFLTENLPRTHTSQGLLESDRAYFQRKLAYLQQITDHKTLFIIDNFDTDDDPDLETFLGGEYTVIFTTRSDFRELGLPVLQLGALDPDKEQMLLFSHYFRRPLTPQTESVVRQILVLVNGHTLAIELIAKYMSLQRVQPDKMLELLQASGVRSIQTGTISRGFAKNQSVYDNILQLFNLYSLTEQEQSILMNLALAGLDGLEVVTFADLCELEDFFPIDELIRKSWICHDPVEDTISLHPLIRDVVITECRLTLDACSTMLKNLTDKLKALWGLPREDKLRFGQLGKSVYTLFPDFDIHYAETYIAIAAGLRMLEQFELSHQICEKCLQVYRDAQGDVSPDIAEVLYKLGDNELARNHFQLAAQYLSQAIGVLEKCAPGTTRLAYMIKFLAWIRLGWLTDHEETERLLHRSNEILSAQDPVDLSQMASQNAAYATLYYLTGQYEKALSYADSSYAVFVSLHGELHGDTLAPMCIKARILSRLNRAEESVALCMRVIDIQKQLMGEDHQAVLNRYEVLAEIWENLSEQGEAIQILRDICAKLDKRQDSTSPFRQRIDKKLTALVNS